MANWENIYSLISKQISAIKKANNFIIDDLSYNNTLSTAENQFKSLFSDDKYDIKYVKSLGNYTNSGNEILGINTNCSDSIKTLNTSHDKINVFLFGINGPGIGEFPFLNGYIISSEFNKKPLQSDHLIYRTISFPNGEMTDVKDRFNAREEIIRVERSITNNLSIPVDPYYLVFIRITDKNDPTKLDLTPLKNYLLSTNSRNLMDVKYNYTINLGAEKVSPVTDFTPRNVLYSGAPGTGKSHKAEEVCRMIVTEGHNSEKDGSVQISSDEDLGRLITRVTFYEDYSYENFVGCYKPVKSDEDRSRITYEFRPGPFINTYINAIKHPTQNYCLIIEEINRAKAASVFGDMFQLLDRNGDGQSDYDIVPDTELDRYLSEQLGDKYNGTMSLTRNFYIYATMNSADQGVSPLDSAFKRRWSFVYMDIKHPEKLNGNIALKHENQKVSLSWNKFRELINDIITGADYNEDKCLGEWFFKPSELTQISDYLNADPTKRLAMPNPMADKLYAYLYQDVFRHSYDIIFKESFKTLSELRASVANFDITDVININKEAFKKALEDENNKPEQQDNSALSPAIPAANADNNGAKV